MSFSDTDSMVPGAVEPLLDMECGGNSVKRATRPSTEGNFSVVSSLRWTEENVTKYRESKTPTLESIQAIDYSRRLELFETASIRLRCTCGVAYDSSHCLGRH